MLLNKVKDIELILGSASPRRKQLLTQLGLIFSTVSAEIDEFAPANLNGFETAMYVSELKANALRNSLKPNQILITSDTEVWQKNKRFGKPHNLDEAKTMLLQLSGKKHHVYSGVTFTTTDKQHSFWVKTSVHFKKLKNQEISYYLEHGNPLDKAGAYGIQEWIGLIGITKFNGSYTNVVGMPMTEFTQELEKYIDNL